jgi:hypothetical protein
MHCSHHWYALSNLGFNPLPGQVHANSAPRCKGWPLPCREEVSVLFGCQPKPRNLRNRRIPWCLHPRLADAVLPGVCKKRRPDNKESARISTRIFVHVFTRKRNGMNAILYIQYMPLASLCLAIPNRRVRASVGSRYSVGPPRTPVSSSAPDNRVSEEVAARCRG